MKGVDNGTAFCTAKLQYPPIISRKVTEFAVSNIYLKLVRVWVLWSCESVTGKPGLFSSIPRHRRNSAPGDRGSKVCVDHAASECAECITCRGALRGAHFNQQAQNQADQAYIHCGEAMSAHDQRDSNV